MPRAEEALRGRARRPARRRRRVHFSQEIRYARRRASRRASRKSRGERQLLPLDKPAPISHLTGRIDPPERAANLGGATSLGDNAGVRTLRRCLARAAPIRRFGPRARGCACRQDSGCGGELGTAVRSGVSRATPSQDRRRRHAFRSGRALFGKRGSVPRDLRAESRGADQSRLAAHRHRIEDSRRLTDLHASQPRRPTDGARRPATRPFPQ